jgi:5-bromo-4-chloroindolyl phosphate hydrolysis protein
MKSEVNRINQMECDMAEVKTDIKYIKSNIEEIKEFIKGADNRYAAKKIELWIYSIAGLIITIVISTLIYSIIK